MCARIIVGGGQGRSHCLTLGRLHLGVMSPTLASGVHSP